MPTRSILAVAAAIALGMGSSWAGSIGLYSSADCSASMLTLPVGESAAFYVRLDLSGLGWDDGAASVMFRVEGLPPEWQVAATPCPGCGAQGDPFGAVGVDLSFANPFVGTCIEIYAVTVTATTLETDVLLRVSHVVPPFHDLACPLVSPACTRPPCAIRNPTCVDGGTLLVNCETLCPVAVDRAVWTRVKRLYE